MRLLYSQFILFLFLLTSCALPSPEFEEQEFVPKKDVIANSIYKEGTDLYRAGRMLDAELSLRQALYLYPDAPNMKANLALVLKSNGLYAEANKIYEELIKTYPEAYDYVFALADSYYREKRFSLAEKMYEKAMFGYEKDQEIGKAAQAARSLASVSFLHGNEEGAVCGSLEAVNYAPGMEQAYRHVRILLATGRYVQAQEVIVPFTANIPDIKDPAILKLFALVAYANGKTEEAKDFIILAYENQVAGLKENDAELAVLRRLLKYKYPEPTAAEESEEELEIKQLEAEESLVFNEQNMLYWPANLVSLYYEYQATLKTED